MSLDICLCHEVDLGGPEPACYTVYEANYTHNCNVMAREAGIYGVLWRPEENGIETAGQLIAPLRAGIKIMEDEPARFIALNPSNGWGSYDTFLPWVRDYLQACIAAPKATVSVSR